MADETWARLGAVAERRWGLISTAQAEIVGVSRTQLSRMAAAGALERVSHGVYRMAGAPRQERQPVYATWLALGGATTTGAISTAAAVVAAGTTAAVIHDVGDFALDSLDFIVPSRRVTRLPEVRLRVQHLSPLEVIAVNGLPTLTVERTIADLVALRMDLSLVADVARDAVRTGQLVAPHRLVTYLSAATSGRAGHRPGAGMALAQELFDLATVAPDGWARG